MEETNKEKIRAFNTIWNGADDYSFVPEFEEYDRQGKPDLYWNYIVGTVHKFYDYPMIQDFFTELKKDPDHGFYEGIFWLGLENSAYKKGLSGRPVVQSLREEFAFRVANRLCPESYYYLVDELRQAHFSRIMGIQQPERQQIRHILDDLEFDESLDTTQVILRMREIINQHFATGKLKRSRNILGIIFSSKNNLKFANPFQERQRSLFSTHSDRPEINEKKETGSRKNYRSLRQSLTGYIEKKERENIQELFGASILSEAQIQTIEKQLCTGNHQNCHLHLTRGEIEVKSVSRVSNRDPRKIALVQREKNLSHYHENLGRNINSIFRLSNILRNVMLLDRESTCKSNAGMLDAGRIWRNIYLDDNKVFQRNRLDEIGNVTFDILLDASGSQMDRQETIAEQAFVIAESLTRCRLPVRVYSFFTKSRYTVVNLFRDYDEPENNNRIFNFYTTGCNRDGLAVRASLQLMDQSICDHKVLIILSDSKPVDPSGFPNPGFAGDNTFYGDEAGISDTAIEVRKGREKGVSILCVYTGVDDDVPAARKIFGPHMIRVTTPEKFAQMAGILIRNELQYL